MTLTECDCCRRHELDALREAKDDIYKVLHGDLLDEKPENA